jgi:hypothetical protein
VRSVPDVARRDERGRRTGACPCPARAAGTMQVAGQAVTGKLRPRPPRPPPPQVRAPRCHSATVTQPPPPSARIETPPEQVGQRPLGAATRPSLSFSGRAFGHRSAVPRAMPGPGLGRDGWGPRVTGARGPRGRRQCPPRSERGQLLSMR